MKRSFKNALVISCLIVVFLGCERKLWRSQASDNHIQPYKKNPYYWQYKGKPVLLLGGTKDDNLFQIPDLEAHLDKLKSVGGNYIRNVMSSRDPGNLYPFVKLSNGKYDLNQWDKAYWERFENMLRLTGERDIIVQIELWAYHDFNKETWPESPWRPLNNINYDTLNTKLKDDVPNLWRGTNNFLFTVPNLNDDQLVLEYQQKFVNKILSYSLEHHHVLYCITNEIHPQFSPEWGWYWAKYLKARAAERKNAINITEMFWEPDFTSPQHKASFDYPGTYTFFEASQNSANSDQENGDNMRFIYKYLQRHPRPINHVKIYGSDSSYIKRMKLGINSERRFWRNIFGGSATSRFHRPPSGQGLNERVVAHLKSMRLLTKQLDIFQCTPDPEYNLLSDRSEDEAYLIYREHEQYAVYFPKGGDVGLNLSNTKMAFKLKWLDILNSKWTESRDIQGGDTLTLTAPGPGQWAALVTKTDN